MDPLYQDMATRVGKQLIDDVRKTAQGVDQLSRHWRAPALKSRGSFASGGEFAAFDRVRRRLVGALRLSQIPIVAARHIDRP